MTVILAADPTAALLPWWPRACHAVAAEEGEETAPGGRRGILDGLGAGLAMAAAAVTRALRGGGPTSAATDAPQTVPVLHVAATISDDMVRAVLATRGGRGVDEVGAHTGATVLAVAAEGLSTEVVAALLAAADILSSFVDVAGPAVATTRNNDGRTPLHVAVPSGWPPCVSVLLSAAPAAVGAADQDGMTPVMPAVALVGARGGDAAAVAMADATVVAAAAHVPALRLPVGDATLLQPAAARSARAAVRRRLAVGADPHPPDADGRTPLLIAAAAGHAAVAGALLGRSGRARTRWPPRLPGAAGGRSLPAPRVTQPRH